MALEDKNGRSMNDEIKYSLGGTLLFTWDDDKALQNCVGDRFIKMGQRNLAILNAMLNERERTLSATSASEE